MNQPNCQNCGCGLTRSEEERAGICTDCQDGELRVLSLRTRQAQAFHEREVPAEAREAEEVITTS